MEYGFISNVLKAHLSMFLTFSGHIFPMSFAQNIVRNLKGLLELQISVVEIAQSECSRGFSGAESIYAFKNAI
jgi:hypothetical protein